MYARHASVGMVKPAGTGTPSWVISARPTPLPPSRSRPPSDGSSKSKTKRGAFKAEILSQMPCNTRGMRPRAVIRKAVLFSVPPVKRVVAERDQLRDRWNENPHPPGHFYSPIPDWAAVVQEGVVPDSCPGIDLNDAGQLKLL